MGQPVPKRCNVKVRGRALFTLWMALELNLCSIEKSKSFQILIKIVLVHSSRAHSSYYLKALRNKTSRTIFKFLSYKHSVLSHLQLCHNSLQYSDLLFHWKRNWISKVTVANRFSSWRRRVLHFALFPHCLICFQIFSELNNFFKQSKYFCRQFSIWQVIWP